MINPFLTKPNYIRIYGHRGARGDIVENSISGFKYTFDLGIKAVEFDVVISKDNIPIIFHDYRLNPDLVKDASGNWITDKTMKLVELTYDEISKYNIESIKPETKYAKRFKNQKSATNERIPKLTDFFKLVTEDKYKDVFLNLEIKSTPTQENVTPDPEKLVSLILKDIKDFTGEVEWDPKKNWFNAFRLAKDEDKEYLLQLLENKEDLEKPARIWLSTIHAIKGGEQDNVILCLDIGDKIIKAIKRSQDKQDEEHRVWYVGTTRARNNLYKLKARITRKGYQL